MNDVLGILTALAILGFVVTRIVDFIKELFNIEKLQQYKWYGDWIWKLLSVLLGIGLAFSAKLQYMEYLGLDLHEFIDYILTGFAIGTGTIFVHEGEAYAKAKKEEARLQSEEL